MVSSFCSCPQVSCIPMHTNFMFNKTIIKKNSTDDDHQRVKFDSSRRKFQKREKHLEVEKPVLMGDDYGWGGCAGGGISSSWSDHPGHFPVTGWAHKLLICDKYSINNSYTAMQSGEHCHQPPLDCIRCDVLAAGLSHCILGHCQQAECRATLPSHYHTPRCSPIQFWALQRDCKIASLICLIALLLHRDEKVLWSGVILHRVSL